MGLDPAIVLAQPEESLEWCTCRGGIDINTGDLCEQCCGYFVRMKAGAFLSAGPCRPAGWGILSSLGEKLQFQNPGEGILPKVEQGPPLSELEFSYRKKNEED